MRVSIPVALSALPRPALFACGSFAYGYGATTLSFSRPTAAPDWPTSSWAAQAEQVVRRAGCHVLVVRENEREFVRNTKRAIGRYRRPRRR